VLQLPNTVTSISLLSSLSSVSLPLKYRFTQISFIEAMHNLCFMNSWVSKVVKLDFLGMCTISFVWKFITSNVSMRLDVFDTHPPQQHWPL
jgi:hypothetical protein